MEARRRFWMVDGAGLVTRGRADAESMPDHLLPYCHEGGHVCPDLASAVAAIKPSVLIGISDGNASVRFGRGVVEAMAAAHARPIILPLSYPGACLIRCPCSFGLPSSPVRARPAVLPPSRPGACLMRRPPSPGCYPSSPGCLTVLRMAMMLLACF